MNKLVWSLNCLQCKKSLFHLRGIPFKLPLKYCCKLKSLAPQETLALLSEHNVWHWWEHICTVLVMFIHMAHHAMSDTCWQGILYQNGPTLHWMLLNSNMFPEIDCSVLLTIFWFVCSEKCELWLMGQKNPPLAKKCLFDYSNLY